MVWIKSLVFLQLLYLIDGQCWNAWNSWHGWNSWWYWSNWESCSKPCGGGVQKRYRCTDVDIRPCSLFCRNGYEYRGNGCDCPIWRSGSCCETCRDINMPHCQSGRQTCGGSPDNIKCTQCFDPYYSGGYGKGCLTCPTIADCDHRHCMAPSNTKCIKCIDDNVFFKRTTGDTKCERLCAWNNHYCWPGTCGSDLTKNCQCSNGFNRMSTNDETSCQPSKRPEIQTCLTAFVGSNGEKKQTSSSTSSTACKYLEDVYGNFQVTRITYDMLSDFTIPAPSDPQPKFINEFNFGVTDVTVYFKKALESGRETEVGRQLLLQDTSKSMKANQTFASNGNVSTSSRTYNLQNGDWLCVEYESLGGGYLKSIDISKPSHPVLDAIPYRKTATSRNLCYRYDDIPPAHCKAIKSCSTDPLFIQDKVTKLTEIPVSFQNWFDPIPTSGDNSRASSIESYQITVHETIPSNGKVQVDSGHVFTKRVNFTETSMVIALNSTKPLLYCIALEVKDIADNVRQSRGFVLYDNSTHIEIRTEHPLTVNSASVNTKYMWQTHHNDICVDWKDHFTNLFYQNNKFLNSIEPDRHGLITGVYDQIDGVLPVSGTVNVNGIIRYTYFWALNSGNFSRGINVANVTRQFYCKHFDLKDGQTYTLKVQATDIANNICEDNTTVHIDRSVPHIKNIWLQKGNHTSLFVHDSKELSSMNLHFEALDPHSGIQNIQWSFGTTDFGKELLNGTLKAGTIANTTCPAISNTCYCPDVGNCETYDYAIPLNGLVSANKNQGNHNRNYYFSIKVTNNALLSNIEHVQILVDDSPPETGVVLEGPVGSPDVDYTSDDSIIINWHGFIDHESGIKLYHVGLARRCLNKDELVGNSRLKDMITFLKAPNTIQNARLQINTTGKFFVSVVAINNAMDPSDSVCSDGFIRDISPPGIHNLTILHAGWAETIGCLHGKPWLLTKSLSRIKLQLSSICLSKCLNTSELINAIPVEELDNDDNDIAEFLCTQLPSFADEDIIYLPDDYIFIRWNSDEQESQVDDYFIGFGRDPSEKDSPSIVSYASTNRRTYFKRRHEGIGSNSMFYVFLKAINKAGLSKILTIGPVVIDVTPPLKTKLPVVEIQGYEVKVSWDNNTFYDTEQTSPLNQIMFQFATESGVITPLHEWKAQESHGCVLCFKYPLAQLQAQDNDLAHDFYVKLFIYNNAGHFLEVSSDKFRLPSKYPPGQALVYDIDPDSNDSGKTNEDVDVHFANNMLCVYWKGFKHHELMRIEIGVGLDREHDDVVKFYKINNTGNECINSTDILFDQEYFVLVRASCSGGQTVSSSNGVRVLGLKDITDTVKVKFGKSNLNERPIIITTVRADQDQMNITFDDALKVGTLYHMSITDGNSTGKISKYFKVQSDDVIIKQSMVPSVGYSVSFKPVKEFPVFLLKMNNSLGNISAREICITEIENNSKYITSKDRVSVYWYLTKAIPKSFRYEVRIQSVQNSSRDSSYITDKKYVGENKDKQVAFTKVPLKVNDRIKAELNICSYKRCFGTVHSDVVTYTDQKPSGEIGSHYIYTNSRGRCLNINVTWTEFHDETGIEFYTWAITRDLRASQILTEWTTHADLKGPNHKIQNCLHLPVYAASEMFICVRAFSMAGIMGQKCSRLVNPEEIGYPIDTVYDFDTSSPEWEEIKKVIHSHSVGEKMTILHEHELNVGTAETKVGAAMVYATERMITWYLMTSSHVPVSCKNDITCKAEISTHEGFVIFPNDKIQNNKVYYTCIRANETIVHREFYEEKLEELTSCSNGFIIDNIAPTAGKIIVRNQNGYITSSRLDVSWKGFTDNVDAVTLGYSRNIAHYQCKLGSRAGYDDILKSMNISAATMSLMDFNINDASTVYVTVTAFDYANLQTTVVSEGFLVDKSPPTSGEIILGNKVVDQLYSSSYQLRIHLRNFNDLESGIKHFEVNIGSYEHAANIMPTTVYTTDDIECTVQSRNVVDGHRYFIRVTAVNRAGLNSKSKEIPIIFDTTSPTAGQVLDGDRTEKRDVDFQSNVHIINGHWTGFSDEQSQIAYYTVGLGTRPYSDDVKPMVYIGLTKDVSWKGPFDVGQKYFITVEAFNGAGLRRQLTSDGITLDNSPPVTGLVRVGTDSRHQTYQRHNSSVRLQWAGFEDPQSGIAGFEACIGSSPFSCDVIPVFPCLLQSDIMKTGLNLPLGQAMYASITAYNNVGMTAVQTSNPFIVDESPPEIVTRPEFLLDYNSIEGIQVQWEKSVIRVHWEFQDTDSPIVKHEITLVTHHEGHTPVEHLEIGNVNKLTINLDSKNWLHNGDTYSVLVTCCNAADHCTTAQSSDLLIDSTPPFLGGFKPPMLWENFVSVNGTIKSQLVLTWYGFQDEESNIQNYFITASRFYSGNELSDGIINILSTSSKSEETANITLTEALATDEIIVLTIWAQNKAGLNSSIGRISVNTLLTSRSSRNVSSHKGILEIQKHSCEVHYCNRDCTCAVLGQPCIDEGNVPSCKVLNDSNSGNSSVFQGIIVKSGLKHAPQNITASSACLAGHWTYDVGNFTHKVTRFEWSAGLKDQPIGEGIFDLKREIPWHDIGLHQHFVHCLSTNATLQHGEKYIIYVRAWYHFDQYAEFQSRPITVDNTTPTVRRGRFIKDSDSTCKQDFDFIDWTDRITACWDGVFDEQQGKLVFYTVSFGTSSKADDTVATTDVGMNTSFTVKGINLRHGTKYFFTVTAYNNIAAHTTIVSDGFVIDTDKPKSGIVFNTLFHKNEPFQSSTASFSISWHGFEDHHSGIHSYYVTLLKENGDDFINAIYINVGLETSYTFKNRNLTQGFNYVGAVKAVDAAGHFSQLVYSSKKAIDTTPAQGQFCANLETIGVINDSILSETFKNFTFSLVLQMGSVYVVKANIHTLDSHVNAIFELDRFELRLPLPINHDSSRQLEYTFFSPLNGQTEAVIKFEADLPVNGTASISKCSEMIETLTKAVVATQIGPDIIAVDIVVKDEESSIHEVLVGAGSTPGGFQIRSLTPIYGGNNGIIQANIPHGSDVYVTAIVENYAGIKSTFFAEPIKMDHTPPKIGKVRVSLKPAVNQSVANGYLTTVSTEWKVLDDESGIKECYCSIGRSSHSADLVRQWKSKSLSSCVFPGLDLQHGTEIYLTVKCINNVELATVVSSNPVVIIHKAPNANQAKVSFVELSKEGPSLVAGFSEVSSIQTNTSHLRFEWSGFTDEASIASYEYRLLHGDSPIIDWADSAQRTMATIAGHQLTSGETYIAEVKAFNGRYDSAVIRSSMLIYKENPRLSGTPILTTQSGGNLHLDWSEVFQTNHPTGITTTYSLSVGTRPDFNDIVDIQNVTTTYFDLHVPESTIITEVVKETFVTVTCYFNTGLSAMYKTSFKI